MYNVVVELHMVPYFLHESQIPTCIITFATCTPVSLLATAFLAVNLLMKSACTVYSICVALKVSMLFLLLHTHTHAHMHACTHIHVICI